MRVVGVIVSPPKGPNGQAEWYYRDSHKTPSMADMVSEVERREWTLNEVARAVNRHPATIKVWEELGKIPRANRDTAGGRRRWQDSVIREWLKERNHFPKAPPTVTSPVPSADAAE